MSRNWRRQDTRPRDSKTLYVTGLTPFVSQAQLKNEFKKFGEISTMQFAEKPERAWITFDAQYQAEAAQENLNGKSFMGNRIRVNFHIQKKANNVGKKRMLWHGVADTLIERLEMDTVAFYSVTDKRVADLQSAVIKAFSPNGSDCRVTDGTACVGGNVYSFSQMFSQVNAMEIDKERYDMLVHNMRVLGANNVTSVHGDYTEKHHQFKQEIIFLDPPWGGPAYKKHANVAIKVGEIPIGLFSNILVKDDDDVQIIAIKLPTNYDADLFLKNVKFCHVAQFQFRKQILLILDYVNDKTTFMNILRNCGNDIPGLGRVVISNKKIREEILVRKKKLKRKRVDTEEAMPKKKRLKLTCVRAERDIREIHEDLHQKIYQCPMFDVNTLPQPNYTILDNRNLPNIHKTQHYALDKTKGNLSLFYIDPRKSRCNLITHNQVSQFPDSIVEGLTVLGLTVLYGICNLDDVQNPVFIIYDACVIDAENICAKRYSERRIMCSQLINQYRENLAKGNISCPLKLYLKEPCMTLNNVATLEKNWAMNPSTAITSFIWADQKFSSDGVLTIPETIPLFSRDKREKGVAPAPLLYVWYFPYLLTAALHVKLPLEDGINFMAYEVKNRKIVSIQKPQPGKTLLPPEARQKLEQLEAQQAEQNPNASAMIVACRYHPRRKLWLPDRLEASRPSNLKHVRRIKDVSQHLTDWKVFSRPLKNVNCHSCHIGPDVKHLYLPEDRKFDCLKYARFNQNKNRTSELIATPKRHVREFHEISQTQNGFYFWFGVMKFIVDQLFHGKHCVDHEPKTPLTNTVTLDISYGDWISHDHAHAHIQVDEYPDIMKKLGFTQINQKPIRSYGPDTQVEIDLFKCVQFQDWAFKSAHFNVFPLCLWVYNWFRPIPGFSFRIVLELKEIQGGNQNIILSNYFIRAPQEYESSIRELLQKPSPDISKALDRIPQN